MCFISISIYVFITLYLKNVNVKQIYLYNINIQFGLCSCGFRVCLDNIHTLFITHRKRFIQKTPIHSE